MKIAINGEIIDTENIYKITKISNLNIKEYINIIRINKSHFEIYFNIMLNNNFSDKKIIVKLKSKQLEFKYMEDSEINTLVKELEEWQTNTLDKISNFREKIIKAWSDNQSTIPQFNIEK